MLRLAFKNLAANAVRLALTGLAIVLGVGFVVSSFVLRDGLKDSFAGLSQEIVQGTDILVDTVDDDPDLPITDADLATVNAIPGVRIAEGGLTGFENSVQPIKTDGTTIATNGPPQISFAWTYDDALNPTTIEAGRFPSERNEWVIDIDAAENHGFVVGETYQFVTPAGNREATLVGTFRFGEDNTTNGATLMGFETETAREFFIAEDGIWDEISVSIDGSVPVPEVQEAISVALGNEPNSIGPDAVPNETNRFEVLDQAEVAAETAASFNQGIDFFGYVLLAFALISLFVSVFIIANTFSIVIGQRIRELGLLRAIGATPSQIRRSVLIESFLIGIIASLVGIVAGIGLAFGLKSVLGAIGVPLPDFDVILSTTTIATALIVGTGVTMLSAIIPALAASRTSPITAISGIAEKEEKSGRRYIVGAVASAAGAGLLFLALFVLGGTQSTLIALGVGAGTLFIGLTLLSPLAAKPLARFLGAPLRSALGMPGELSKENAARNPRRTASTAAALMIGLSLVSGALVLGSSIKAEITKTFEAGLIADYFVNTQAFDIPDEAIEQIEADPAFTAVTGVRFWGVELENTPVDADPGETGTGTGVGALDFSVADQLFNLGVIDGDLKDVDNDSVALDDDLAEKLGLGMGDTVQMVLDNGEVADLEVVALFTEAQLLEAMLITVDRYEQISDQPTSDFAAALKAPDVTAAEADERFAEIGASYPNLEFQSAAEARESFASFVDTFTSVLSAMLGLAILIALVGIANTMALSVFERTREIGLLRAVGMTRRQSRTMIRWEAAIISAVGAILGAAIGLGLGILLVQAIPDQFLSTIAVPWLRILVLVIIASVAGLASAFFPAYRASRMNVLDAISTM